MMEGFNGRGNNFRSQLLKSDKYTDILGFDAPNVSTNWSYALSGQHPEDVFRTVHMVREPYQLVFSAYLYHSSNPKDTREAWLRNRCEWMNA